MQQWILVKTRQVYKPLLARTPKIYGEIFSEIKHVSDGPIMMDSCISVMNPNILSYGFCLINIWIADELLRFLLLFLLQHGGARGWSHYDTRFAACSHSFSQCKCYFSLWRQRWNNSQIDTVAGPFYCCFYYKASFGFQSRTIVSPIFSWWRLLHFLLLSTHETLLLLCLTLKGPFLLFGYFYATWILKALLVWKLSRDPCILIGAV